MSKKPKLSELTKYKVEMTYPSPIPEEIDVEEARSAIKKARRINNFILQNRASQNSRFEVRQK
jgi:hypothetical protein